MPQITGDKLKPSKIYGQSDIDVTTTFRERLLVRFKAYEMVQVYNPDDQVIQWQYLPDHAETSYLTDEGIRVTTRDDPELWELPPGEYDNMIGSCAFLMIENLYKQMVIKRVGIVEHPQSAKQIKNFNFRDPVRADEIIDMIYMGKVKPSFNQSEPNKVVPLQEKKPDVKPSQKIPAKA
jgi:hypothetical protein